jgi:hypothetical protein
MLNRFLKRSTKSENKFNNRKVVVDGISFDSTKESKVYRALTIMQQQGLISELELQPRYELIPAIKEPYTKQLKTKEKMCYRTVQLAITYTADFRFRCKDKLYVVDVKASPKMLPKEYVLKKKMLRYFHNIEVTEIFKISDLEAFTK